MLGIAYALCSSLAWGISDFMGGVQTRRLALLRVMIVSQPAGLAGIALAVAIAAHSPPSLSRLVPVMVGGVLGLAGLASFYRALSIGKMSIVAPIASLGVCLPVLAGIIDGERPAGVQLVGIVAAIIGVILVSREPQPTPRAGTQSSDADARATRMSILLALVAAVGFGSFAVGLRSSARADVLWAVLAGRGAGVAVLVGIFLVRRPARAQVPVPVATLAIVGLLDLAANGLYAVATRHGLLSVIAVAASLYPLVTVLLARVLLGERVQRIQEIGIAAAVAGIALIAAG